MSVAAGAFAEYAVADYLRAYQIPQSFAFETAASLPTSLSTTHNALLTEGRLEPGQTILVQGASAAVGLMVMQVAKLKGAALVIGTSTNAERRSRLSEHGADLALDSSDRAWIDRVQDATGGTGVDLVIDFVSGATANLNLEATRIGGRIVNVGRLGGAMAKFDFNLHALRRITYIGVTARTRSRAEIAAISDGVRADLLPAVAERRLALPIDRVFAFSEAAEALAHMRQNRHFGKIVLSM
jgi:NADPH2:quinone reductase